MNYSEHVLKVCRDCEDSFGLEESSELAMTYHFFKLMGEEHLNRVVGDMLDPPEWATKNDVGFDGMFKQFHKSMRNTDFYDYDNLNGQLDMLFWNFIYISEMPYYVLRAVVETIKSEDWDITYYPALIRKYRKDDKSR